MMKLKPLQFQLQPLNLKSLLKLGMHLIMVHSTDKHASQLQQTTQNVA